MQFKLRAWNIEDLNNLVKYANNYKIARNLSDKFPYPYTEEDGRSFINFASGESVNHIFAIELEGKACGGIGLHPQFDIQCKNAELGYWLGEPFWGKGIMSEAIKQVVRYGFANIEVDRIFARSFGTNIASQKLLEKTGFVLEAKFQKTLYKYGKYEDELIYAVRRS